MNIHDLEEVRQGIEGLLALTQQLTKGNSALGCRLLVAAGAALCNSHQTFISVAEEAFAITHPTVGNA
jgi:hypothetical protein